MVIAFELTNIDVAEADRVAVVLEDDGAFGFMGLVSGECFEGDGAEDGGVVADQDAVMEYGEVGWGFEGVVLFKMWGFEDDVISLPIAGLAGGIDEKVSLTINGVGIGEIMLGVEDLDFVTAKHHDAAIASALAFTFWGVGRREFKVELAISEDVAGDCGAARNDHRAILAFAGGGLAAV